jgi:pyruvate,orthophosphate dikinase
MQDLEFTIQDGKLWMLQTRNGKRTAAAMVKIAMDMLREGMIDEKLLFFVKNQHKLDELLHPVLIKMLSKLQMYWQKDLPASPGAATGQACFLC